MVKQPVEFENSFGSRLLGILFRDPSAPSDVVGDEQTALAQARRHKAQHARVVFFIDIVEDDVVLLLLLGENFKSVPGVERDAIGNTSAIEVAASPLSVLCIAVGVDDAAFVADGLCPPDSRVSDG